MGLPLRFSSTRGAGEGGVRGRRDGHPHVLADLGMDHEAGDVEGFEEQIGAERRLEVPDPDVLTGLVVAGRIPAAFVELAICRQVGLGGDAEQFAAMDHDGAVVQAVAVAKRRSDDEHRQQVDGGFDDLPDRRRDRVEDGILHHQIVDRIPGQAQFGKDRDGGRVGVADACRMQHGRGIGGGIGDRDGDRPGGDAGETVPVGALEREGCAHRPSLAGADPGGEEVSDAAASVVEEGEACAT